jgi:predicted acylesterase/phospholipase RssA
MNSLIDWLFARRSWFFVMAFILALLTGALVEKYNKNLVTTVAPLKIVSLELAWTYSKADLIRKSWMRDEQNTEPCIGSEWTARNEIANAKKSILADVPFIFGYTILLAIILSIALRAQGKFNPRWIQAITSRRASRAAMVIVIIIALLDFVENYGMWVFLSDGAVRVFEFSLPAYAKFGLIIFLLLFCALVLVLKFRSEVRFFLRASRLYAPGIIAVSLAYFVLIRLPQGQDVVIQIGESWIHGVAAIICLVAWAYYSWYSSRLVSYVKLQQPENSLHPDFHRQFPRVIAFNSFVCIQAAILGLPTVGGYTAGSLWAFVIVQNILYFLIDTFGSFKRGVWLLLFTVVIGVLIYQDFRPPQNGGLPVFGLLNILFLVVSVIFVVVIKNRRVEEWRVWEYNPCRRIEATGYLTLEKVRVLWWIKAFRRIRVPIHSANTTQEQEYFTAFNRLALLGLIFYVVCFFSFRFADGMGPLGFTMLALGILVGLTNIITALTVYLRTNLMLILFLTAVLVGFLYDPFKVRLTGETSGIQSRPDIVKSFDDWVAARQESIDTCEEFSVYMVIADGGASRSGYWVSSVLSKLQDESKLLHAQNPGSNRTVFSDHLLCLAGASGGSVGTATFYAMLRDEKIDHKLREKSYVERSKAFLRHDFLTPVLTRWMGSDIIQHILPLRWAGVSDRAGAIEQAMENFSGNSLGIGFDSTFLKMVDQSGRMPILFINTTSVHEGLPAVVSSIQTRQFSKRVDVISEIEGLDEGEIRYSSAVVLGARFPYVSPAGRIGKNYFVDGGYFDNTGAGIVHEMIQKVDSVMKARLDLLLINPMASDSLLTVYPGLRSYSKLKFKVIHLSNSPLTEVCPESMHPLSNGLTAPILTVLGTYGSQTNVNNQRLRNFMLKLDSASGIREVNLYSQGSNANYPMNWVISNYHREKMDERLKAVDGGLKEILKEMAVPKP